MNDWKEEIAKDWTKIARVPPYAVTAKMCKIAVDQNWKALEYVPKLLQTEEIVNIALEQSGIAIKLVNEQTAERCIKAVSQCYTALKYIKNQTPAICKAALEQNKAAMNYIRDKSILLIPDIIGNNSFKSRIRDKRLAGFIIEIQRAAKGQITKEEMINIATHLDPESDYEISGTSDICDLSEFCIISSIGKHTPYGYVDSNEKEILLRSPIIFGKKEMIVNKDGSISISHIVPDFNIKEMHVVFKRRDSWNLSATDSNKWGVKSRNRILIYTPDLSVEWDPFEFTEDDLQILKDLEYPLPTE